MLETTDKKGYFAARRLKKTDYHGPNESSNEQLRIPQSTYSGTTEGLFEKTTRPPQRFTPLRKMLEHNPSLQEGYTILASSFSHQKSHHPWRRARKTRGRHEAAPLARSARMKKVAKSISTALFSRPQNPKYVPRHAKPNQQDSLFESVRKKAVPAALATLALSTTAVGFLQESTSPEQHLAPSTPANTLQVNPLYTLEFAPATSAEPILLAAPENQTEALQTVRITEEHPNLWKATKAALGEQASDTQIANTIQSLDGVENPNLVYIGEEFTPLA